MRHIISKTSLLTILLTAYIPALRAQDADELLIGGDQPGLLTDGMPGIGNLLINGINSRDYQMVQTLIVFYALLFVTINFLTDLVYRALDPRVTF